MPARALDDHDQRFRVRFDRRAGFGQGAPGSAVERVAPRRGVEAEARQRAVEDELDIAHAGLAEALRRIVRLLTEKRLWSKLASSLLPACGEKVRMRGWVIGHNGDASRHAPHPASPRERGEGILRERTE